MTDERARDVTPRRVLNAHSTFRPGPSSFLEISAPIRRDNSSLVLFSLFCFFFFLVAQTRTDNLVGGAFGCVDKYRDGNFATKEIPRARRTRFSHVRHGHRITPGNAIYLGQIIIVLTPR